LSTTYIFILVRRLMSIVDIDLFCLVKIYSGE